MSWLTVFMRMIGLWLWRNTVFYLRGGHTLTKRCIQDLYSFDDEDLYYQASRMLERIGPKARRYVPELLDAQLETGFVYSILCALDRPGLPSSIVGISEHLKHEEPLRRWVAAWCLGNQAWLGGKYPYVASRLKKALSDTNHCVRATAARAFHQQVHFYGADASRVPGLIKALNKGLDAEKDHRVRTAFVNTLEEITGRKS